MEYAHIMPEDIFKNPEVKVYVEAGNSCLGALGFTEHGRPHAKRCSNYARNILEALDYDTRTCELAAIAGYLHDIGNTVNRVDHAHSGAIMAFTLLTRMNMPPEEIAIICSAIGHHDEKTAFPVNAVSAALILSDKSDVRRSRVRKNAIIATDIHDRVNYAVVNASLKIDKEQKLCPSWSISRFSSTVWCCAEKPPIFWGSRSSLSSTTRVCCNTNHTYNS